MITIDEMNALKNEALAEVVELWTNTRREFFQPEHDRDDLDHYESMTDEERGALVRMVGPDRYAQYVHHMEYLRTKKGIGDADQKEANQHYTKATA
jgi:hypothetical protein